MLARLKALHETRGPVPMTEETYVRIEGNEIPVEVTAVPTTFQGKPGALVFVREAATRGDVGDANEEASHG